MAEKGPGAVKRFELPFFEGINSLVSPNLVKKQELSHAENVRSETIGILEKRGGTALTGNVITSTANYGLLYFQNNGANQSGLFRISKVSGVVSIYWLNSSNNTWTALTGNGTNLTSLPFDYSFADSNCLLVNGTNNNIYIESDGTTVRDSTYTAGHLYGSPKAYKVNYYKNKIFLADYTIGSTRVKNGIIFSSMPLGILGLVDGDHLAGVTTINVTDTKFIRSTDSLEIRRGGTSIETVTVSAKTESTITVSATSNAINSADEIWVAGTHAAEKKYRWPDTSEGGINVKTYNTFKLTGGQNESIKMMTNIENLMVIANNNNMAVWDDVSLKNYDLGIGCVSSKGYVQSLGTLWFMHYTGIYATNGSRPKLMSAKVEKYIKGATKAGLEACAAGKKGYSVFFTLGTVTLYHPDGSVNKTLSNVVLEYNLRQENWYVHTDIKATEFATFVSNVQTDSLICSTTEANLPILEFLTGTTDYQNGNAKEIPMLIETHPITMSDMFEKICYPQRIIIEVDRGNGVKTFISLDSERFHEVQGDFLKGCNIVPIKSINDTRTDPPRARKIAFAIREFSNRGVKISQFALEYTDAGEEEMDNPTNYGK